jgi:hypothetical protein
MNLHNPPPSILSRQTPVVDKRHMGVEGKTSTPTFDGAVAEEKQHHNAHYQTQTDVVLRGYESPTAVEEEFEPTHVHSVHKHGDHVLVTSQEQLEQLLETGDWSDTPKEVTKEK